MKKTALFSIFLFLLMIAYPQKEKKRVPLSNIPFHEIQFSLSDPSALFLFESYDYYDDRYGYNNSSRWTDPDEYVKYAISSPAITASYLYRFNRWFWLGGNISYVGKHAEIYDYLTDKKTGVSNENMLSFAAYARFSWFNREKITLYSGFGMGASYRFYNRSSEMDGLKVNTIFVGQMTFIGVEAGGKWFGFAELGTGYKGIFTAGFGYRFYTKKNAE